MSLIRAVKPNTGPLLHADWEIWLDDDEPRSGLLLGTGPTELDALAVAGQTLCAAVSAVLERQRELG